MPEADSSDVPAIFGLVLRKHRKERGISQEDLAHEAGVDRTFIYRIEAGSRQPTISTLLNLAAALQVSAADLVQATEIALRKARSKALRL
jgi:transcriptional regulator with XRE-family HTH domain